MPSLLESPFSPINSLLNVMLAAGLSAEIPHVL